MGELAAPSGLGGEAREAARIWIDGDAVECVIDATVRETPEAWGVLISELARRAAAAHQRRAGGDLDQILERIMEAAMLEIDGPEDGED